MTLLLISRRSRGNYTPPSGLLLQPAAPTVANNAASGTLLATITVQGGNNSGTFGVTGWANATVVRNNLGVPELRTTGSIAGQSGDKALTITYDESGQTQVSKTATVTVITPVPALSGVSTIPAAPVDVPMNTPMGNEIFQATALNGTGPFSWALQVGSWSKAVLAATTGRTVGVKLDPAATPLSTPGDKTVKLTVTDAADNTVVNVDITASVVDPAAINDFATEPDFTQFWRALDVAAAGSEIVQEADGVRLKAGTDTTVPADDQHVQIMSQLELSGDFELKAWVTVLDNFAGTATQEALLLYWHLRGDNSNPSLYPTDLTAWPSPDGETRFENHGNGYRGSFAQLHPGGNNSDQWRVNRAAGGVLTQIIGAGDQAAPGPFHFPRNHKIELTLTKTGQTVTFATKDLTDPTITPPAPMVVTDARFDDHTVGRFIWRAMAAREMKVSVRSVKKLTPAAGSYNELPFKWEDIPTGNRHTVTTWAQLKAAIEDPAIGAGHMIHVDLAGATDFNMNAADPRTGYTINKAVPTGGQPLIIACTVVGRCNLVGKLTFAAASSNIILWGFKRDTDFQLNMNGTKNRIQRIEFTGWKHPYAFYWGDNADDCRMYFCSFHDPAPWSATELAGTAGYYPLRMGVRGSPNSRNCKQFGTRWYNMPQKPDPDQYDSGQSDAFEMCEDVDQMAKGASSPHLNFKAERLLVEASVEEGAKVDAKASGAAVFDLKGVGMHFKDLTLLSFGRLDFRGGSDNIVENLHVESSTIFMQGGRNTLRNVNAVSATWTWKHPLTGANVTVTQRAQIKLGAGNGNADQATTRRLDNNQLWNPWYQRATSCVLEDIRANVTIAVEPGVKAYTFNGVTYDNQPAINNIVRRCNGTVTLAGAALQTGTDLTQKADAITAALPPKWTVADCGHTAALGDPPTLFDFN